MPSVAIKQRVVRFLQTRLINPVVKRSAGRPHSRYALLETVGRRSGQPRQTPVGNGLQGDTFWIVAEHGERALYVKNLMANPRVRVMVDGRWRAGSARVLMDDDPIARLSALDPRTAAEIRRMGTSLLSVRVDLDPPRA